MILLINPPNPPGSVSNKEMMGGLGQLHREGGPPVPPIDIPYVAACLIKEKIPVKIIDCLGLNYDTDTLLREIKKELLRNNKISVALRTSLPTYSYDMEIARLLKKEAKGDLILFGPYVSLNPEETIKKDFIDIIVLGEPEYIFVNMMLNGPQDTKGIWFKNEKGEIIKNTLSERIEDLDQLPFPAWESMPYKNYVLPKPQFPDETPFLPVLGSRGCPFSCTYCPYPVTQGRYWRNRSIDNLIKELEHIIRDLGIKNILFRDPEFTLDIERTKNVCQEMIRRGLNFFWRCETRIDTLDEDLIEIMAKAGCRGINLGIESACEETLQRVKRKSFSQKQSLAIINLCKKFNISTFCFFIIGFPGENKGEVLKTIDFIKLLDPLQAQITFATPYPGTSLREWAEKKNFIEDQDLSHYTGYIPVMRNEYLTINRLKKLYKFSLRYTDTRNTLKKERIRDYGFIQGVKEALKEVLFWFEKRII